VTPHDEPQEKVLGRTDLLLFSVAAVLTMDTLASASSTGPSWFGWWAVIMVLFFIPYGLITAELGSAWPGEGGLHIWVRAGLGPRWGSMASWLYWINMVYWIPPVYLVFAGTFDSMVTGTGSVAFQTGIAIVLTWITVAIGIARLKLAKWIPNLGALVKVTIFGCLGVMGLSAVVSGKPPANAITFETMAPNWSASVAYLPVLLYNVLGFELMSSAGGEMKSPQRDVPRAILASGVIIMLVYSLGALGVLLAVPVDELSLVTGAWDALEILGRQWGVLGGSFATLLGVGFLFALVTNIVTWSIGVNRVAATAASEGLLPRSLSALHPRFGTPHIAVIAMGVISTVLLIGNALLASSATNIFWMTFKLSGVCFLLSYVLMFPAFLALRYREAAVVRPYTMPGGLPGAWIATILCWSFVVGGSVLFFVQSPTSESPTLEALLLGGETLATVAVGLLIVPRRT
jgi:amino acid transporter